MKRMKPETGVLRWLARLIGLTIVSCLLLSGQALAQPQVSIDEDSIEFVYTIDGDLPGADSVIISNTGDANLNWSLIESTAWADGSPVSGTVEAVVVDADTLEVTLDAVELALLSAGEYRSTMKVQDDTYTDSLDTFVVKLLINQAPVLTLSISDNPICNPVEWCIGIDAADLDGDSITLEKVSGIGTFDSQDSVSSIVTGHCFTPDTVGTYRFIFKVTDAYGAVDQDTLDIVYEADTEDPVPTCPDAVSVQCDADVPVVDLNSVSVTDNCDPDPVVTWIDDVSDGNTCPAEITRTYRATDASGNFADCTQLITVDDTVDPEITCPPTANINCDESTDPSNTGSATATDNCTSVPIITYSDSKYRDILETVITRTWIATDSCDNADTCEQTITIATDNVNPVVECPGDISIDCAESTDPSNTGTATATDNCDPDPSVTYEDEIAPGTCDDEYTIIRSWIATDNANNADTCEQTITVTDNIDPQITCPADVGIDCAESTDPSNTGVATATDNCDPAPSITYSDVVDMSGCGGYTGAITRSWIATDACGNADTCVQVITVSDTTDPVVTCPPDIDIDCAESTDPSNTGSATATDNCDANPEMTYSDVANMSGCGGYTGTITRTWTATDECGNTDQCVQTITITDNVDPVITCPGPLTVQCDFDVPSPNTALVSVFDNCDADPVVSFVSDVSDGETCPETITRTYKAVDDCGNESFCTRTITINDTQDPTITCPLNVEVRTYEVKDPDSTGWATAADNCDSDPSITYVDTKEEGSCPPETTITRTWTATDDCENVDVCSQTITVVNTPPEDSLYPDREGGWSIDETEPLEFCVFASDPDLYYSDSTWMRFYWDETSVPPTDSPQVWPSFTNLIHEPGFDKDTFHWTPSAFDAGRYYVHFFAEDNCGDMDSVSREITVGDVNQCPYILIPEGYTEPSQTIWPGRTFDSITLLPFGVDGDEDYPLTWYPVDIPNCIEFDRESSEANPNAGTPVGGFGVDTKQECLSVGFYDKIGFECQDTLECESHGRLTTQFTQIGVDTVSTDFGFVFIGLVDTRDFSIHNPHLSQPFECSFHFDDDSLCIVRDIDSTEAQMDQIPKNSERLYHVTWSPGPEDAGEWTEDLYIKSESIPDDSFHIQFKGYSGSLEPVPEFVEIDFQYVNGVDPRGYEDTTIRVAIVGGQDAYAILDSVEPATGPISVLEPIQGTQLNPGDTVDLNIRATTPGDFVRSDVRWYYTVHIGEDSIPVRRDILEARARGLVPQISCSPSYPDTLQFGSVPIGRSSTEIFKIYNHSPVTHVIHDIGFGGNHPESFETDADSLPVLVLPGDSAEIPIVFYPEDDQSYYATVEKIDSVEWDTDPPNLRGIGIIEHWIPDATVNMDPPIELCGSRGHSDFDVQNVAGFNVDVDSLYVDYPDWFTFDPPLENIIDTLSGTTGISLDFTVSPRKIGSESPDGVFRMRIVYHNADASPPGDSMMTFDFPLVKGSGCAGLISLIEGLDFDSVEIGNSELDHVFISNTGECDLEVSSVTIDDGPFSVPGSSFDIGAGETYDLPVTFEPGPTHYGRVNTNLTVYHNGYPGAFVYPDSCPLRDTSMTVISGIGKDAQPPVIDSVVSVDGGEKADIYVHDEGVGVKTVTVKWRRGDALSTEELDPTNQPGKISDTKWEFTLSPSDMSLDSIPVLGYELYITAIDGAPNETTDGWFVIGGSFGSAAVQMNLHELCGGHTDSMWHLVTIPGKLERYDAQYIFQTLSGFPESRGGNVHQDSWRLLHYNPSDSSWLNLPGDSKNVVVPGRGYWFRQIPSEVPDVMSLPSGTTWPTDTLFAIELQPGWNLIGSPYFFPVWMRTDRIEGTVTSYIGQNPDRDTDVGSNDWHILLDSCVTPLEPWTGYAIRCENELDPCYIYLDAHYDGCGIQPVAPGSHWGVPITLFGSGTATDKVTIGYSVMGSDGPDILDCRPISFFGALPKLVLNSDEHGAFIRDIRSGSGVQVWQLDITPVSAGPLTLAWEAPQHLGDGIALVFRDIVAGCLIDMTGQSGYSIPSSAQLPPGRFRIYLGTSQEVESESNSPGTTRPVSYHLYPNFPNPFNPSTSIAFDLPNPGPVKLEIFNIKGEQVRILVDGYQERGSHLVRWDGRNSSGDQVATGMYFSRLVAGTYTSSVKMVLVK